MCCQFLYNYSSSIISLRYVEMHQCITNVHHLRDQYPISNESVLLYNYHVILSDDFSVQLFQLKSETTRLSTWMEMIILVIISTWLLCAILMQKLIMACDFTYMLDDLICPLELLSSVQLYCASNKSYFLRFFFFFFFSVLLWSFSFLLLRQNFLG